MAGLALILRLRISEPPTGPADEQLVTHLEVRNLLLVGANQDNEVAVVHPDAGAGDDPPGRNEGSGNRSGSSGSTISSGSSPMLCIAVRERALFVAQLVRLEIGKIADGGMPPTYETMHQCTRRLAENHFLPSSSYKSLANRRKIRYILSPVMELASS
jgi:hypothetical protein